MKRYWHDHHLHPTTDGQYVRICTPAGDIIRATIHRPRERRPWRLCFAGCTGAHAGLLGKVIDAHTLRAINDLLAVYDTETTE